VAEPLHTRAQHGKGHKVCSRPEGQHTTHFSELYAEPWNPSYCYFVTHTGNTCSTA
jgi:hypothetical protein